MSVRHALLALLSSEPKYGGRLRHELESVTGELWALNVGQIYTTLSRLERDGLIHETDVDREGARHFELTGPGRNELERWLRTPPSLDTPPRDELVTKMLVASDVPDIDVAEIVQLHRLRLVEAMQSFTRIKAAAPADDVGVAILVDAELFRLEAVLRWLDAAEARLAGHHRPGPPQPTPSMVPSPAPVDDRSEVVP